MKLGKTLHPGESLTIGKAAIRTPASKYRNVRVMVDGITFQSKAEARRYGELKLLERGHVIFSLRLQQRFPMRVAGYLICNYVADFTYCESGRWIAEDAKGAPETAVFKLKAKLFKVLYPNYGLRIVRT